LILEFAVLEASEALKFFRAKYRFLFAENRPDLIAVECGDK